jgi:predicted dehydrogenase
MLSIFWNNKAYKQYLIKLNKRYILNKANISKNFYSVAIIGLGNVGLLYDYFIKNENNIVSHAKAFEKYHGFRLLAGVDPSIKKRNLFKKKYSNKAYKSIFDLFKNISNIDLIVISTPSNTHLKILNELIPYDVKNILCEKPMGSNIYESQSIYNISKDNNINLCVNYIRRFDPEIIKIKSLLLNEIYGSIQKIIVFYSGELWNIASHFIDLTFYFLSENEKIKNIKILSKNKEGGLNFYMKSSSGIEINFISCLKENFEILEFQIITEKNRIRLMNGGREIQIDEVVKDNLFVNYKILDHLVTIKNTEINQCQYNVVKKLYEIIDGQAKNISSRDDAIKTSSILSLLSEKQT